jgi:hypothetical protein
MKGEQSTWPMLALIRNRCIIELELDKSKYVLFILINYCSIILRYIN